MIDSLVKLLEEKHGKRLNLENETYYLFLKGGLFSLYYDADEKSIKAVIEMLDDETTFVYFSNADVDDILKK